MCSLKSARIASQHAQSSLSRSVVLLLSRRRGRGASSQGPRAQCMVSRGVHPLLVSAVSINCGQCHGRFHNCRADAPACYTEMSSMATTTSYRPRGTIRSCCLPSHAHVRLVDCLYSTQCATPRSQCTLFFAAPGGIDPPPSPATLTQADKEVGMYCWMRLHVRKTRSPQCVCTSSVSARATSSRRQEMSTARTGLILKCELTSENTKICTKYASVGHTARRNSEGAERRTLRSWMR